MERRKERRNERKDEERKEEGLESERGKAASFMHWTSPLPDISLQKMEKEKEEEEEPSSHHHFQSINRACASKNRERELASHQRYSDQKREKVELEKAEKRLGVRERERERASMSGRRNELIMICTKISLRRFFVPALITSKEWEKASLWLVA